MCRRVVRSTSFVVIELKTGNLIPADIGQLNFYVASVDGEVARAHHAPTIGLLLCATRNERTVRYALSRSTSPMAVAGYRYHELPAAERAAVPDEHILVDAVDAAIDQFDDQHPTT
jgi:YhcG PDDEXK nuclease domain